jgi:hypothetical protein
MADAATADAAVDTLVHELQAVFGRRLVSVAVYGGGAEAEALTGGAAGDAHDHVHTIVIAESIEPTDLRSCAGLAKGWNRAGLATPLLMASAELDGSLDAFPLELSAILFGYRLVAGTDVLAGLAVATDDIRRACEVMARSHLLHLREGYVQSGANPHDLAAIIPPSVRPFRLLLTSLARLKGIRIGDASAFAMLLETEASLTRGVVKQVIAAGGPSGVSAADAQDLYPSYIQIVEQLVQYIDSWQA